MNFKEFESATKLRGGYYTKPEIAAFLLRWVMEIRPEKLLEPSCGDGVFIRMLPEVGSESVRSLIAFEIEKEEAAKAQGCAVEIGLKGVEVYTRDFLSWSVSQLMQAPAFDAVVGNPPFIRYQYLDADLQDYSEAIFRYFDLPFTKHTNAWVPFVLASVAMLRPGGRLGMVVPAEILHVLHAQSLRTFLTQHCSQILIVDPQELWFEDALQGAVLLLAEKKTSPTAGSLGVAIIRTRDQGFLSESPSQFFSTADFANGETVAGKWMLALLSKRERELLKEAEARSNVYRFSNLAEVDVGIVTGANKFFLVPDAVVEEYGLDKWAHPMFGRSEHVPGVIYDSTTHEENRRRGLPTNFLWFNGDALETLPKRAQAYLRKGEVEQLHKRYKCRIRTPWYRVPSVYASPVGMLKRSHDFPRLILNELGAFTTDTAYRIRVKEVSSHALVFSFINSLTALSAELEGRHYGGGVLELVPSEIERLLVPVVSVDRDKLVGLDRLVRGGCTREDLLQVQDRAVLLKAGFTASEADDLRTAWSRLRARRHRTEAGTRQVKKSGSSGFNVG